MNEKIIYIILTILNCFLGSIAAYLLKKSSSKLNLKPINKMVKNILNSGIIWGAGIYFLTALGAIFILRKLDVSVFFPLTATTYIFSLIIANKFLNEKITKSKIIGICLIILGVIFII